MVRRLLLILTLAAMVIGTGATGGAGRAEAGELSIQSSPAPIKTYGSYGTISAFNRPQTRGIFDGLTTVVKDALDTTVGTVVGVVDGATDAIFNNNGGAYNVTDGDGGYKIPIISDALGGSDGGLFDTITGALTGLLTELGEAVFGTGDLPIVGPLLTSLTGSSNSDLLDLKNLLTGALSLDDTVNGLLNLDKSLGLDLSMFAGKNGAFGLTFDKGLNLGLENILSLGATSEDPGNFLMNIGGVLTMGGGSVVDGGISGPGAMLGILSGIAGQTVKTVVDTLTMTGGTLSVGDNKGGNAILDIGNLVAGATGILHVGDNLSDVIFGNETLSLGSIADAATGALGGLFNIMYHENSTNNQNLALGDLLSLNVVVGLENALTTTVGDALLTINSLNVGDAANAGIFNGLTGVAVDILEGVTVTTGSLLSLTGAGSTIGGDLLNGNLVGNVAGGLVNLVGTTVDGALKTVGGTVIMAGSTVDSITNGLDNTLMLGGLLDGTGDIVEGATNVVGGLLSNVGGTVNVITSTIAGSVNSSGTENGNWAFGGSLLGDTINLANDTILAGPGAVLGALGGLSGLLDGKDLAGLGILDLLNGYDFNEDGGFSGLLGILELVDGDDGLLGGLDLSGILGGGGDGGLGGVVGGLLGGILGGGNAETGGLLSLMNNTFDLSGGGLLNLIGGLVSLGDNKIDGSGNLGLNVLGNLEILGGLTGALNNAFSVLSVIGDADIGNKGLLNLGAILQGTDGLESVLGNVTGTLSGLGGTLNVITGSLLGGLTLGDGEGGLGGILNLGNHLFSTGVLDIVNGTIGGITNGSILGALDGDDLAGLGGLSGLLSGGGLLDAVGGVVGGVVNITDTVLNLKGAVGSTVGGLLHVVGETVKLTDLDFTGNGDGTSGLNIIGNLATAVTGVVGGTVESVVDILGVTGGVTVGGGSGINLGSLLGDGAGGLIGGTVGGILDIQNGGLANIVGNLLLTGENAGGAESLLGFVTGSVLNLTGNLFSGGDMALGGGTLGGLGGLLGAVDLDLVTSLLGKEGLTTGGLLSGLTDIVSGGEGFRLDLTGTIVNTVGGVLNLVGNTVNLANLDFTGDGKGLSGLNIIGDLTTALGNVTNGVLNQGGILVDILGATGGVAVGDGSGINLGSLLGGVGGVVGGVLDIQNSGLTNIVGNLLLTGENAGGLGSLLNLADGGVLNLVGNLFSGGDISLGDGILGGKGGLLGALDLAGLQDLLGGLKPGEGLGLGDLSGLLTDGLDLSLVGTVVNTVGGALNLVGSTVNLDGLDFTGSGDGLGGLNIVGDLVAGVTGAVGGVAGTVVDILGVTGNLTVDKGSEINLGSLLDLNGSVAGGLVGGVVGGALNIVEGTVNVVGDLLLSGANVGGSGGLLNLGDKGVLNLVGNLLSNDSLSIAGGLLQGGGGLLGVVDGVLEIVGGTLNTVGGVLNLAGDTVSLGGSLLGDGKQMGLGILGNLDMLGNITNSAGGILNILGVSGNASVGKDGILNLGSLGGGVAGGLVEGVVGGVVGGLLSNNGGVLNLVSDITAGGYAQSGGQLSLVNDLVSKTIASITGGELLGGLGSLTGTSGIGIANAILNTDGGALKLISSLVQFGKGIQMGEGAGGLDILGNLGLLDGVTMTLSKALNIGVLDGLAGSGNALLGSGSLNLTGGLTHTVAGLLSTAGGGLSLDGGSSLVADAINLVGGTLSGVTGGDNILNLGGENGFSLVNTVLDIASGVTMNVTSGLDLGKGVTSTGTGGLLSVVGGALNLGGGLQSLLGLEGLGVSAKEITDAVSGAAIGAGDYALLDDVFSYGNSVKIETVDGMLQAAAIRGTEMTAGDTGRLASVITRSLDSIGVSSDSRGFVSDTLVANAFQAATMQKGDYDSLGGTAQENVRLLSALITDGALAKAGFASENLSGAEALAVGQSLSGQTGVMSTIVGANTAREAGNVVGGRVDMLKMEVNTINEANSAIASAGAYPSISYYDPVAATSVNRFWLSGFGMWEDADTYKGHAGYEYRSGGMMLGYDRFLNQNFAVGGSFGYTKGGFENKMALGNDSTIESYSLNTYAGFFHSSGFFASAKFGYTYSDNDMSTLRTYGGGWEDMENSTNSFYTGTEIGYDWKPSETLNLTFTPTIGLYYYDSTGSDFTSSKGIEYGEQTRDTWSLPIDFAVSYGLEVCENGLLTFGGHVGYAYDFNDEGTQSTASIQGVGGSFGSMGVEGRSNGRHQLNLGTSAKYEWKQFEVGASYDYFRRAEYDGHKLSGNFAIKF